MKVMFMILLSTLLLPNESGAVPQAPKMPVGLQTHLPQDVKKPPKQVRANWKSFFRSAN